MRNAHSEYLNLPSGHSTLTSAPSISKYSLYTGVGELPFIPAAPLTAHKTREKILSVKYFSLNDLLAVKTGYLAEFG